MPVSLSQVLKFIFVGLGNTLVDAGLYFALTSGAPAFLVPRLAAKGVSYLAGVANSFYWNRRWTFRSTRPAGQTFLPFLAVNLAGLGLNVALLHVALAWVGLPEVAAVAVATGGVVLLNFSISKYVIFKPHKKVETS
jgi:putative flippase GtrA